MQDSREHAPSALLTRPRPAPALDWPFLQRTAVSTVVAASLVALGIAVYVSVEVGARYLMFALWALVFFATTGLIFRNLMFNQNRARGLAAVAVKVLALVGIYAALWAWPIQGEQARAHMIAMVAGVTTPLVVLILRVLAWAMDQNRQSKQESAECSSPGKVSDAVMKES